MSLSIVIGGQDVTGLADTYTFSNVARGGFEQAQITLSRDLKISRHDEVLIFDGGSIAWHGYINSPGQVAKDTLARAGITALGYGTRLKTARDRFIFLDADTSQWKDVSLTRQATLLGASFSIGSIENKIDNATGRNGIDMQVETPFSLVNGQVVEAMYDSKGCGIGAIYGSYKTGAQLSTADTNWSYQSYLATDDTIGSSGASTGPLRVNGTSEARWSVVTPPAVAIQYIGILELLYAIALTGNSGVTYDLMFYNVQVVGMHGVALYDETTVQGLRKSIRVTDVVNYLLDHIQDYNAHQLITDDTFAVPHWVHYDVATYEDIINEAANFLGWVWGTWEPPSLFDSKPTFRFEAPPADITCFVSTTECDEVDEPVVSLDHCYNGCSIKYQNALGQQNYVNVYKHNPVLDAAGIPSQYLLVEAGIMGVAAAQVFGGYALKLAQASQRGGGSVTVSGAVHEPGGGSRQATLLRAGRDRIRVPELNDGSYFVSDTRSLDAFQVERVETTVTGGRASTRVEFDTGADLMEVLNARIGTEKTAAGIG